MNHLIILAVIAALAILAIFALRKKTDKENDIRVREYYYGDCSHCETLLDRKFEVLPPDKNGEKTVIKTIFCPKCKVGSIHVSSSKNEGFY